MFALVAGSSPEVVASSELEASTALPRSSASLLAASALAPGVPIAVDEFVEALGRHGFDARHLFLELLYFFL